MPTEPLFRPLIIDDENLSDSARQVANEAREVMRSWLRSSIENIRKNAASAAEKEITQFQEQQKASLAALDEAANKLEDLARTLAAAPAAPALDPAALAAAVRATKAELETRRTAASRYGANAVRAVQSALGAVGLPV